MSGWQTSIGANGKAHFYDEAGRAACADRKGIWPGCTLGDLFTRPKRETAADDHICHYCALKNPRLCLCWNCKVKRLRADEAASKGDR